MTSKATDVLTPDTAKAYATALLSEFYPDGGVTVYEAVTSLDATPECAALDVSISIPVNDGVFLTTITVWIEAGSLYGEY